MANQQSGGAGFLPEPSGYLYLTGNQLNLVSGTVTLVNLNTIATGFTDGIEDTGAHKITPGVAGLYIVTAHLVWTNVVPDKAYEIMIYKNAAFIAGDECHASLDFVISNHTSVPVWLTPTDYLQLKACSYAGVDTVDIYAGIANTYLTVQRVR